MTTSLERDPMTTTLHPITPALAHVGCAANLLVHAVEAGPGAHCYRSVFAVAGDHPYLYENPAIANHVSGTTFIDMGRQLLKAIAHLFYGLPLNSRFVLHGVDIEFLRWAKLGVDIEVTVVVEATAAKRTDAPRAFGATLVWHQEGHLIARARSRFTTFSNAMEARLMARQYGQAPCTEARDLERRPLLAEDLKKIEAVVFDPPRAGAAEQARQIAKSAAPVAVAVSCNPATFARDARLLVDGGFVLEKVTPVDQFLWSPHIELVAVFRR